MFDFIRVAAAVPNVAVGDTDTNTNNICKMIEKSLEDNPRLVVFPELCITGYTCADLFFQKALLDSAKDGLNKILEFTKNFEPIVAVGLPLEIDSILYNCAVFIKSGKIYGIVPKTYIPSYNEFYEKRWFSSASSLKRSTVLLSEIGIKCEKDAAVPIGSLVFDTGYFKFGAEICEDLWSAVPPSSMLALYGAEVIVNLSASNDTISKRRYRKDLVSQQSARLISAYVYTSAGCTESTTDLIFSGHSIICENGTVVAENKNVIDSDYILFSDIDLGKLRTDRLKVKTFQDGTNIIDISGIQTVFIPTQDTQKDLKYCKVRKLPFVPDVKRDRTERCMNIFEMQVMGLKKRMEITNGKPVIGVSGGLDSTLALLVCAEAARRLSRPSTDVIGITMPCFGTTDRTYNNSLELMRKLNITAKEISIKNAVLKHFKDIGHPDGVLDLTFENSQARERTQVLMDYAGKVGGFVVGTGDLSELALGWCTYNADHMSMYGVNCGVPKTLVRWMVASIMEGEVFSGCSDILADILDTPISPELLPPDENGKVAQQTEEIVGPYSLHDFFIYYAIRFGFRPKKVFLLAKKAFSDDFDDATIKKWLVTFYRRFFSQQFKRSCLPDGVKIGSICLSPRGDWRMPSDASAAIWLKEAESIEV